MKVNEVQALLRADQQWKRILKDPVKMQEWRELYEDLKADEAAEKVKRVSSKAATQAASKSLVLLQAQVRRCNALC